MRSGAKEIIVTAALFLTGCGTVAQTTDSTVLVSSATESGHEPTSMKTPGKHFYTILLPGREGLQPTVLYNGDDRFFVGLAYNDLSSDWKADSTGCRQTAHLRYSVNQKAFSIGYEGIVNRLSGTWNLYATATYDWVKWTNFYGLGNETRQRTTDADYYRLRSRDAYFGLGFQHRFGRQNSLTLTPFYQRVQLLRNEDRFLSLAYPEEKTTSLYTAKNFIGLGAGLLLQRLNDLLLPTKGITFSSGINHTRNTAGSRSFTTYNADVKWYLPFLRRFVFVTENGGATVTGQPEFYQVNSIGGTALRGYRSDRFWGQTVFHNNNEVQYLFDAPAKFFKGKLGLTAFVDQGRVWLTGEESNVWHRGYGGGVLLAVYNKLYLAAQLGISNERKGFHFTLRRSL